MYSELALLPSEAPTPLMVMPGSALLMTGSVFGWAPGSLYPSMVRVLLAVAVDWALR